MIFAHQSTDFRARRAPSIIALVASTRHPSGVLSTLRIAMEMITEFLLSRLFFVRTVIIGQRNIRASFVFVRAPDPTNAHSTTTRFGTRGKRGGFPTHEFELCEEA